MKGSKNIMKKLVSLIAVFAMVFATMGGANASEPPSITPISESDLNTWHIETENIAETQNDPSTSAAATLRDLVSPMKVTVVPLVYVKEDNAYYLLDSETRVKNLSGTNQAEYFKLTPAQTASYISEINAAIAKDSRFEGKTANLFGWHLECVIKTTSSKPLYLEIKGSKTCLGGTEPLRIDIPYTTCSTTVTGNFSLVNSEDLTAYQNYSFTGGFHFIYANGGEGNSYVGTGFIMNTKTT